MAYPTGHILEALKAEDAEAVDTFCAFVEVIRGMDTSPESVRKGFNEFLRLLKELHS